MPLLDILPSIQFHYSMSKDLIDNCERDKYIGININGTLNFSYHSDILYSRPIKGSGYKKGHAILYKILTEKEPYILPWFTAQMFGCPLLPVPPVPID